MWGAQHARKQPWAGAQVGKIILPVSRSHRAGQKPPEGCVRPGVGTAHLLHPGASAQGRPVCKSAFAERAGVAGSSAE